MKLKRLVVQGYKTFATKTEFIFDEGITAVVGPNGSGKSNIADAVRWVLGEQSYGTLRGKRTTDMIFAGSQHRARASMASVMLTLDNDDGWLPIDYSEVEIGRRAYRSGENDYLLNGQKVRLKDISQLLATSGLAQRTYTIIGQGLVDQALSLRAEERRALFEEAAGISHYKSRRAETLRRLKDTQRNLERVYDVLGEIAPRLRSLKRQATRARNYDQINTDLRELLRIWYGYRWQREKDGLRLARETAVSAETAWQQSRQQLRAQQEKIDDTRQQINRLRTQINSHQEEHDDLRRQHERAERQVAILQERARSLGRQLGDVADEMPTVASQQTAAQAALTASTAELVEAQTDMGATQGELQRVEAAFQVQQVELRGRQDKMRQAEASQRKLQNKLAQAQGQLTQLRERLRERQTQPSGGDGDSKIEETVAKETAVIDQTRAKQADLQANRDEAIDQRTTLIRNLKQRRRDGRAQEKALQKERTQLARLEARLDMLDQMRQKKMTVKGGVNVVGRLAAALTIAPAHQRALEATLAARLETIILPDEANLWKLATAHDNFTAIVADAVPEPIARDLPEGTVGWATDIVEHDGAVAAYLLDGILLVQDAKAAYAAAKSLPAGAMAVGLDGFVARAGGWGEQNGRSAADSILTHERNWREAKSALDEKETAVSTLATAVDAESDAIQAQQQEIDDLQGEERRLGGLIYELNQRIAAAERRHDQAVQQQKFAERQRAARAAEAAQLATRIEGVETAVSTDESELVTMETAVSIARAHLEAAPTTDVKQQREALQQRRNAAQTIVAGRQAVVDSRRATLQQLDRQLSRLQERQQNLQTQQQQLSLADEEAMAARLQQELTLIEETLAPLREQLKARRGEMDGLEEKTAVVQEQAHHHETRHTQTQIALNQRQNQLDGLLERIHADLGIVNLPYDDDQTGATPLPMEEVVEQLPIVTELPADIEKNVTRYRAQLQRMGAINPDAPAEYDETAERHTFLTQQVQDLTETEAQLRKVISELDVLTSRAFAETVERVDAVFGDIFTQLFGGGSARLALTDPDDLTVSGVDIITRLPNRREQGLGLLSGGERSLTAAALIFSLLRVSPTPFCIMDEVDAALDEANVNRFRDLLHELSIKTQFVVITHNRGTVQAAHTIYGISMGTDSASQVLSIKPEEYVKQADLL